MQLGVEVYWHPGEATFVIRGELDGRAAADLTERLTEVARVVRVLNGEPGRLVLDLAGVTGMDQAAARGLVAARQQLLPNCSLLIESPSPAAKKNLGAAGLLETEAEPEMPEQAARGSGRAPGGRGPAARDSGRAAGGRSARDSAGPQATRARLRRRAAVRPDP